MKCNIAGQTETDILSLDISDEALERAAGVGDGQRITVGPLSPAQRAAASHQG